MGINIYTMFIDLIKVYNSIKYNVILLVLKKIDALERYIK